MNEPSASEAFNSFNTCIRMLFKTVCGLVVLCHKEFQQYSCLLMYLGPTQPPVQWVPGALSLGIKRQGREADHSPTSSAEVKECVELYIHSPSTSSWRGAQLKHRENFTFTFINVATKYLL
jgi:hypothetical protein